MSLPSSSDVSPAVPSTCRLVLMGSVDKMKILQMYDHSSHHNVEFLLLAYMELSVDVTCCCKTADATLGWSGMILVMISPVMTCWSWFSWIALAGTLMVNTRFSVSLAWGGRVIWIGMSLFGSRVVCWRAGGPFWACDVDCDDVVAWPGSVLMFVAWGFFVACKLLFGMACASGGTCESPFVFPLIEDAALFFCSAANAFFDFVPFA